MLIGDRFLPRIEDFKGADDLTDAISEAYHIDPAFWTLHEKDIYFQGNANPIKAAQQGPTDWSMSMDTKLGLIKAISELIEHISSTHVSFRHLRSEKEGHSTHISRTPPYIFLPLAQRVQPRRILTLYLVLWSQ